MRSYGQYCGLALALDQIGDRWTLLIVRELVTGPKRYSDLLAGLPGVATNLLASRLKGLESAGLVEIQTLPPPASSTVYALTEIGRELDEALLALVRWGGRFMRRRARGQTFRAHWLAVALRALLEPAAVAGEDLVATFELPEGSVMLRVERGRVHVGSGETDPDVRIRGRAELILGLVSGEMDWDVAATKGLEVSGSERGIARMRSLVVAARIDDGSV
jgi:DNA-binding HxlR family transcriptional regulator